MPSMRRPLTTTGSPMSLSIPISPRTLAPTQSTELLHRLRETYIRVCSLHIRLILAFPLWQHARCQKKGQIPPEYPKLLSPSARRRTELLLTYSCPLVEIAVSALDKS